MARRRERDEDELSAPSLSNAIFAGEEAAATLAEQGITGPQQAIALARQLKAKGASRATIHRETSKVLEGTPYAGVVFGPNDGKPRFEITDHNARFKPEGMPVFSRAPISTVLDHPELYKAVPSVGMAQIERGTTSNSGYDGRNIEIGKQHVKRAGGRQTFEPSAMGPTLHEIQHDVQARHRLNPGGSPEDFPGLPPEVQKALYQSIDGEQEAEMTRKRQSMTPAERRANPPKPDVPWADQIDVERELADARRQRFIGDLADVATDAWKRLTTREVVEGRPIHQRRLDPRKVSADPAAFQFKSGGDASGVTDRLKGVKEWDALAAGKQIVYERANGERVIADGHQRRGLALRAIEAGQKGVMLDAYVLREKDGWSTRDVRAYAALKNMKESSGNPLDMAKVMRERPDLAAKSLPMSDAKIRDAVALSKLSPAAFDLVESGVVKAEHAAPVGAQVKDTGRHADLLTEMAKAGMRSAEHARLYVSQAMAAPSISETTGSLFGDETKVRSLLAERAKVLDRALGALKSDKRIFAMLEREAANIETAGNRLAHASNLERADTAGRLAELVERLSTTRGPVSEMLDRAAMAMAEGKTPAQAARGFVTDVGKTMKGGGINALTGGDAAPMVQAPDPNQNSMFGEDIRDPTKNPGWSAEAREASAKTRKGKAKGRKQMMIEDGSPKPSKDIVADVAKGQNLAQGSKSTDYSRGWKDAKSGIMPRADGDPTYMAGYDQYAIDKSPRAAERAMVQYLAKEGEKASSKQVTLAGKTMPENGKRAADLTERINSGEHQPNVIRKWVNKESRAYGWGKPQTVSSTEYWTQHKEDGKIIERGPYPSKAVADIELAKAVKAAAAQSSTPAPAAPVGDAPAGMKIAKIDVKPTAKGQTSFLPDATTKEQLAAAAKAKGRSSAGQQGMDDGLFGSGMNQTDLVEMAKQKPGERGPNESYWTNRTERAPRVDELPPGAFDGTQSDFEKLSPGMRREIERTALKQAPKAPEGITADSRYKFVGESRTLERGPVAVYMDKTSGVHVVADKNGAFDTSGNPLGARQAPSGIEMAAAASNPESRFHASASKITDHVEFHSAALTQTENTGYKPLTNAEIVDQAKGMPKPSAERVEQLTNRLDRINKAQLARAARGDEAGYEKSKRIYDKAQDAQLKAVAATKVGQDAKPATEDQPRGKRTDGERRWKMEDRAKELGVRGWRSMDDAQLKDAIAAKPAGWSDAAREASATERAPKDVRSMNIKELRAEAKAQGIRLGSAKTKAQITERLERGKPNIFGSQDKYGQARAKASTASDPFAVNLTLTAQRDGRFAIQDALDKMSPKQVRAAAKAQGIYISASTPDADVKMTTVKAAFTKVAERIAAAGGDASKYRQEIAEIERNMRTASKVPVSSATTMGGSEGLSKTEKAELKRAQKAGIAAAKAQIAAMSDEPGTGLRGTQNAANREAIAKNRKANAKGKPGAAAQANAELAARKEKVRTGTKVSGETTLAALNEGAKPSRKEKAAAKRKAGLKKDKTISAIGNMVRNQSFIEPTPAAPAKAAPASTPVSAKPTALARAGHAFNVAGTAGLGVGIAAAAVIAANESAKAGESTGKQAAAAATAATVAAAPAAVVGGGMYAAAKYAGHVKVLGTTVGKAIPGIGWGIAAAAAAHGAYTEGRKASAEGKGAAGIAKAAGWGAVNSVVPIDAAVEAARGVRGRLSAGQAAKFQEASEAFQRDQQMHTTQTDYSDRKPGWSPEARIAAAKAKGAALPYGGDPSKAPGYVAPKTYNGKLS